MLVCQQESTDAGVFARRTCSLFPFRCGSLSWLARYVPNINGDPQQTFFRCYFMRKININQLDEMRWSSPKGKFAGAGKEVSEALGRKPQSTDLNERHPFDVEIVRLAAGQTPYPYHSHSAQW